MSNPTTIAYASRSNVIQFLCPVPKRHLQELILKHGLKTGLDIGCGEGSPLTSLREFGFKSTGIDIDAASVERARAKGVHDDYIEGDFMTMKLEQAFDVVVLSHVIEHFDRDTGWRVLQRMEQISRHLVYVETPNGFLEQTDYDGNLFMRHLSGWFPHDFSSRGYAVYGSGPKWLCAPVERKRLMPSSLRRFISRLLQRHYFRRPSKAGIIAGFRFVDDAGNLRIV